MGRWQKVVITASMVAFVVLLALALSAGGLSFTIPAGRVRDVARWYLFTTFNPDLELFSAMAPEGVTSIVWDYRGLDTLFETAVFFLAIIGSVAIMRDIKTGGGSKPKGSTGLSPIVKTVTRITVGVILAVAASIALHGHLTPGGGFQGGATAAVAPLLILVIFSRYYIERLGVSKNAMLAIRSLGLIGIAVTAFIVLAVTSLQGGVAYVFQNQPKSYAPAGMPYEVGGSLTGGTLLLFNIFEMFAVSAGFTIIFLLLAIPESEVLGVLRGGGDGH